MNYIKLSVHLSVENKWTEEFFWVSDIFKDALIGCGYDSFVDIEDGFEAYCPQDVFSQNKLEEILKEELGFVTSLEAKFDFEEIEQRDWNAEWEKNYPSVLFPGFCVVRPPFNPLNDEVQYDIVIEPKMSFGTAHHQTTSLIIECLAHENVKGKRLMDMGCGTGVLAILAAKMGAIDCMAVDNDTWAAENAKENVERKNVDVKVLLGDSSVLNPNEKYDVFIANINRNILLDNMPIYAQSINVGGVLFLSGFYENDVPILENKCKEYGLLLDKVATKDNWAAMRLIKTI
ncbi:MAG: 50S ribosomal protein L11 methyltransferase [Bacteroidales bacterium]|nr:50S ribosomal protein L11 methyltransferase [Bacteroidales bacterium]